MREGLEAVFRAEDGERPRAILVGIEDGSGETEQMLDELSRLLDTSGGETYARLIQAREKPDARTYIGSGKIEELRELCESGGVKAVVFDTELSPAQIKNIEDDLGGDVTVIDRSMLILDIFALHAVTDEGKIQVELAQLQYSSPRLVGRGTEMSRQGGGIASRGPGETKLETDRRRVRARMAALRRELDRIARERELRRYARKRSGIMTVAIAGYTNAGKSTLLNYLTGAGILAEDKLFATLDPTTRKYALPDGTEILLTDTVGFIRKLPHHLVKAFHSTLEEITQADAIIALSDASDTECEAELKVTTGLLEELGAGDKPVLYVFNKCDRADGSLAAAAADIPSSDAVFISARTGEGVDELVERLGEIARMGKKRLEFHFPASELGCLSALYGSSTVEEVEYVDDGAIVTAVVDGKTAGQYARFVRR